MDVNGELFDAAADATEWVYPLHVAGGVAYRVRIRACNSVGPGPFSAAAALRLPPPPPPPPTLRLIEATSTALRLAWTYEAGVTAVMTELVLVGGRGRPAVLYKGAASQFRATKLRAGHAYELQARGFNESGWGALSSALACRTPDAPLAAPPQPTVAVRGTSATVSFPSEASMWRLDLRCRTGSAQVLVQGQPVQLGAEFATAYQGREASIALAELPVVPLELRLCRVRGDEIGPPSAATLFSAEPVAPPAPVVEQPAPASTWAAYAAVAVALLAVVLVALVVDF